MGKKIQELLRTKISGELTAGDQMLKETQRQVYMIGEIDHIDPALLGGKGAGLAQMHRLDIPIPPGFIVTTDAGVTYFKSGRQIPNVVQKQIAEAIQKLSKSTGKALGNHRNPLLVSVRSGAPISMPGQMSTILNVGLDRKIVNSMQNKALAGALYGRLYRMLATAMSLNKEDLHQLEQRYLAANNISALEQLSLAKIEAFISDIQDLVKQKTGKRIPSEPEAQLWLAIRAVWDSWDTPSMRDYRRTLGIKDEMSTAVVVQCMVLGNLNENSGTGVIYSRNPITGEGMTGSFLFQAQGEEVVSGERRTYGLDALERSQPAIYGKLIDYVSRLENHYKYPVEVEFTIESGKLWLLQVRKAVLSDRATIQHIVYLKHSGQITDEEAVEYVKPSLIERLNLPVFSAEAKQKAYQEGRLLTRGMPASPGVGTGVALISAKSIQAAIENNQSFILVRQTLDPKEHTIFKKSNGIISASSSVGSHGALMANVLKKPCIVGCENISDVDEQTGTFAVNGKKLSEGSLLSVDGTHGEVFEGRIGVESSQIFDALQVFEEWWQKYDGTIGNPNKNDGRSHSPWANATYSVDPQEIEEYRQQARKLLTQNNWSTEKAQVVEVMHLLPEEARINQVVIDARNEQSLKTLMYDVIEKGCWNGPRTALGPNSEGSSPWQMGIKTHEQVDAFLTNPDFQGVAKAPKAGYRRWMHPEPTDKWPDAPVQIIVMYDPPEKGMESVENEHFVCNITCRSNPDEINVDINLGTAQLRSFERIMPNQLIRITMALNSAMPYLRGQRTLVFGENYWDKSSLPEIANMLGFGVGDQEKVESIVKSRMEQDKLPEKVIRRLVGERTYKVARFIETTIFEQWWLPPFKLPFIMRALDEVYSLQVLELQGRANQSGDIVWFSIYDAKGREEKATVGQ